MADILAHLHAVQHPDPASCTTRRLLLVRFSDATASGEGAGYVLSRLVAGMGEAAHAGRTLVWGAELPRLLADSAPAWSGAAAWVDGRGLALNCSGAGTHGGGSHACLFAPLSTCTLRDVSRAELRALRTGGFSDGGRVRVQEARRGPAAFVPPRQFRGPGGALTPRARHRWAGALAAFVFRLRPEVASVFASRAAQLLRAGGGGGDGAGAVWGVHVRHGDVSADPARYANRAAFPFRAYFDAAAAAAAASPAPPAVLFVASDDPGVEAAARAAHERLASGDLPWPRGHRRPRVIASPARDRDRARGGAHVAAFDDATAGRAGRLLRVLAEAVEDLYLLGRGAALVATGCSTFAAFAALLVAAGSDGASAPSSPVFLDAPALAAGVLQSGFVLLQFNGTRAVPPDRGWERWSELEALFTGAPMLSFSPRGRGGDADAVFARAHPDAPPYGLAPDGLPLMAAEVFDAEAATWGGDAGGGGGGGGGGYACGPLLPEPAALDVGIGGAASGAGAGSPTDVLTRVVRLMRRGEAWVKRLPAKGLACWAAAGAALDACVPAGCAPVDVQAARKGIADAVARASKEHLRPYSLPRAELEALVRANWDGWCPAPAPAGGADERVGDD